MMIRLPLLLAACAVLAYASLREAEVMVPGPLTRDAQTGPKPAAAIQPPPAPPSGPWVEQTGRPLFAVTRRPPEEEVTETAAAAAPEPLPPVAASGVVLRNGHALALLRLANGQSVRAATGDEVDGWRVGRISAEGVEMTLGDRSVMLAARVPMADGLLRSE
ncbi:hypothetical protein [Roseomonas marmotae]|uniref:Type II secretion system protein GspC N-terminal domain-containing protein n=1 Tax=Roseomonas marmotae TaxID=2768161 RepID=A0ABS3KC12_9PROT|nr:hypothetical protein [Roseomonas marmotae]MBO1075009.1 hypothetical protein [Roseomonas marmotae]QTI79955.1 hypothetical protein IAI58_04005 [Roseomonas marmotae]